MADYEFWLTDDSGARLALLDKIAFATISRSVSGYGTCHVGIPLNNYKITPIFLPDRRIDVWRSASTGITMRREGSFLLRKWRAYQRQTDGSIMIEFFGRSPLDILRRQSVVSYTTANFEKTDYIDDMMKEIVYENFISPQATAPSGEFSVEGDHSLGPSISHSFFGQNVLDVLKELKDISIQKNNESSSNKKIYFDVVEGQQLTGGGFSYIFRTYAGIRGTDRSLGTVFSVENGNLESPSYIEDHLDSATISSILNSSNSAVNGSAQNSDRYLSRWNDIDVVQLTSEDTLTMNNSKAAQVLTENKARESINATFLNSPGSKSQPRSLYGIDWDLGDILPAQFVGKSMTAEVSIVYITISDDGKENIIGLTSVQ